MLQLDRLGKQYRGGHWGVREVTLEFAPGVVGLLGHNGAGKTTLMQMIACVTRPTEGGLRFKGVDLTRDPDALRRRLGYLPQDFGVYPNLTGREFLEHFAALKGVRDKSRIDHLLELVNLHQSAGQAAGGYSGGMRQRLGIAQALLNDPEVLVVDEPTAGLDPEERVRFRNLLSDLGAGRLVLLSTHIVSDLESIATRITMIHRGRLLGDGTPEAVTAAVAGKVWRAELPVAEYEQARGRLRITGAVRRGETVQARIVHPERPLPGAEPAVPGLEDAFVWATAEAARAAGAS